MGAFVTLIKRSVASYGRDKVATFSAAIAYYTVFSLFPLALVGVSILGFFVGEASARDRVVDGIVSTITLGDQGEDALRETLANVNAQRGWIGLIGLATSLWAASGLFGAIRTAMDRVWDVDRPLPMLRAKARDLLLLFGFGGLLVASTASTGVLRAAREVGASWIGPLDSVAGPVFALVVFIAPLLLTFAAFMFLYRVAPHARLTFRDVWPAAVLAALFFEFGKNILTFYILSVGGTDVLAGTLGAAILFLVFVYWASQVILFGAEIAKHRLLVADGTLPATDPQTAKPKVPFGHKVAGMLTRLWKVDEKHHDPELPYEPARMDLATNRPTNTREEVIMKWEEARENVVEDAASAGANGPRYRPNQRTAPTPATPSLCAIAGEALRLGDQLVVQSEGKVTPVAAGSDTTITRNGEQATLNDIRAGDWVRLTFTPDGAVHTLDVTDRMKAPSPDKPRGGTDWVEMAGFVASLAVGAYMKLRGRGKEKDGRRERAGEDGAHPILRRKPSE